MNYEKILDEQSLFKHFFIPYIKVYVYAVQRGVLSKGAYNNQLKGSINYLTIDWLINGMEGVVSLY